MISELRLAQTMHLSCTDTNTVSKWIETRFHMTNVTEKIHRVRPKWFLSLWFVWRKLCSYLASGLALSPTRPRRPSTWSSSPRSTIGCVQIDFCAYGTFGANRAPILHWHYHCHQMDWNEIPHDQCLLKDSSGASKMISKPTVRSAQPCTYLASRLALSPNKPKRASTWASSPRSTIGCVRNDFWAYGTFDANRAPIVRQG
jgi:hypothetical protein